MFGIINLSRDNDQTSYWIKLARVENIMKKTKFNQQIFIPGEMKLQYLRRTTSDDFGQWGTNDSLYAEQYLIVNDFWG